MTTEFRGSPLRLLDSPVRFMQMRAASESPHFIAMMLPVIANALSVAWIDAIQQSRVTVFMADHGISVSSVGGPALSAFVGALIAGLLGFAVHAGALVTFDMFTARSTAKKRRCLVDLSAAAYWSQLAWSIPALAAVWWFWDPPALIVRGGTVQQADVLSREPLQIVLTQTRQFAHLWLIGLHAVALRVVSGLTVGGAWAAGITLATVFVGGPWVIGTIVQRFFF